MKVSPARSAELLLLFRVPMPAASEPGMNGGTVRHMLAVEQGRRQTRLGKERLRHRALRVCGLAACGVLLVKGPSESWHDYLHRTTCCPAHRNQYRAEVRARQDEEAP